MKKNLIILFAMTAFFILAGVLSIIFIKHYEVTTIYVEGNIHYTNEEIMDKVMQGRLGHNSLYLSLKYRNKGVENVPFVEKMDVKILAPDTIKITVYEKALAGYFEYLDRYMYFDRDGVVVETSDRKTKGIPLVTGLSFGHVVMYEKLPIENPEVFEDVLDITQLLNKYDIQADRIYFDKAMHKTLYYGDTRISLGSNENIGEKIMELKAIYPELEGKKGVLRLDNYSPDVKNITFELDE